MWGLKPGDSKFAIRDSEFGDESFVCRDSGFGDYAFVGFWFGDWAFVGFGIRKTFGLLWDSGFEKHNSGIRLSWDSAFGLRDLGLSASRRQSSGGCTCRGANIIKHFNRIKGRNSLFTLQRSPLRKLRVPFVVQPPKSPFHSVPLPRLVWWGRRTSPKQHPYSCRVNMAHARQSTPNSGLGVQVRALTNFKWLLLRSVADPLNSAEVHRS